MTLLLACGGPAPELGLSGPPTVELIWGSSSSLELTLERNETALEEVTLSVEGLPDGVTGRFEPATVAGDALSSSLHLDAARDAAAGFVTVTVRAVGADALEASHSFTLDVRGLTVEGRVAPLAGSQLTDSVILKVGSQWVATDPEGRFTAHQVAVPYDLVVKGTPIIDIYTGLTTATPHVKGYIDASILDRSEAIEVTGTISPTPAAGERISVCTDASHPIWGTCTSVNGNGVRNTYRLEVNRAEAAGAKLYARREVLDEDGISVGFTGYVEAALPTSPEDGEVLNLSLVNSSSTPIPFALDHGGRPVAALEGRVSFGPFLNSAIRVSPDVFLLPDGAKGALVAMVGDPASGSAITLQPISGPLPGPIPFGPPLEFVSPAAGTLINDATEFVTSDPEGALVSHTFLTSDDRIIAVHTFKDRVRFSELAAHIDGLSARDIEQWLLATSPGVTTPEQALEKDVGYMAIAIEITAGFHETDDTEPTQRTLSGPRTFASATGAGSALDVFVEQIAALRN